MSKQGRSPKIEHFRLSLNDDITHKQLWVVRFTRTGLFVIVVSLITVIMAASFSLIAFTPIRTFIPGYPDAHTKREAINNALRIDSLQNVIYTWLYYTDNLKRIMDGENPATVDSIIRTNRQTVSAPVERGGLSGQDSLLRESVKQAEKFGLNEGETRKLPIEGIHFFTPLKGVVSQGYDPLLHPFVDITAPANSVVAAALDGTVINAGWSDDFGYTIQIQHSDDIVTIYKHNQKLLKKTGDKVVAGAPIAIVGNTGALTTGEHLHFELWHCGEAVDPTKYINF